MISFHDYVIYFFCINARITKNIKSSVMIVSLAGLSLKSQDLTALFLAVRLYCSFVMEYDIHTVLDTATLAATLFVIYMIRFKLRPTYMVDKDNFALYYVVRTTELLLHITYMFRLISIIWLG